MPYYPWVDDEEDATLAWLGFAWGGALAGQSFRLRRGEPCASWFPKDFEIHLEKSRGTKLASAVPNTESWLCIDMCCRASCLRDPRADSIQLVAG